MGAGASQKATAAEPTAAEPAVAAAASAPRRAHRRPAPRMDIWIVDCDSREIQT